MPTSHPGESQGGGDSAISVRLVKVGPTQTVHVWAASDVIGGLFQHWAGKQSSYCDPVAHGRPCRRPARQWRGYTDVWEWDEGKKLYLPRVLEITPHCELCIRGLWQRGQIWAISRGERISKRRGVLSAELVERRPPRLTPPAFDILPCLAGLYGSGELDLSEPNPLPMPVRAEPQTGAPPVPVEPERSKAEQNREYRAKMRAAGYDRIVDGWEANEPSGNGQVH